MKFIYFLILFVGLSGCASEIEKRTSDNYTLIGMQAQSRGNWDTARKAYARAVVNGEQANIPAKSLAIRTYEYGRALGVTCFFDLAESELNRAYELDKKAGQPLYFSLTELARLTFDQQKFQASINYFERTIKELDLVKGAEEAPIEYSNILDEYSVALSKIGRETDAINVKYRSTEIRKTNPQRKSITDRTPYGKYCTKQSSN